MTKHLKSFASAALCAIATAALAATAAQARPDTRAMTCGEARGLVEQAGGIVLSTGPHTYARFVANRGFCLRNQLTRAQFAPTRDVSQCFAGYECYDPMVKRE